MSKSMIYWMLGIGIIGLWAHWFVGIYRFHTDQDIFVEPKSIQEKDLIGSWLTEIPGQKDQFDGFEILANGQMKSINSATLLYKSWRKSNDTLYFVEESVGNGTSSTEEYPYKIMEFQGFNKLTLSMGSTNILYRKQ